MLKTFIERPVLSTVISIIIVLLGVLGLETLPVEQYPDIAPATVRVSASYPGANAQTVMESVIIPIEEKINGVEGMDYISSTASNDGSASIEVVFQQGVDPDIAAVNVQNQVALANPILPTDVTRAGVTTQKRQPSSLMFLSMYSDNPDYDAVYVNNYTNINVVPVIQRVKGVGDVTVFGRRNYSIRIWIEPAKMKAYGLVPGDIASVLREQSLEAAAGQLGENHGMAFQYTITYSGRFKEVEQYENIVIKSLGDGNVLRLKDVANIELGALAYTGNSEINGHPAVSMSINQTKGSNAQEIIRELKSELDKLSENFPAGIHHTILFDTDQFLSASINKVFKTLIEAFILVFLVVFIFLQDFRSTLIPLIAVPVSIVGTFFFLEMIGFSLNLLTLFALVLAIGIVVDDAIVVVEAVHAKMEQTGKDAKTASIETMHELAGAIISITLVMVAVFVPVTFVQGATGVFYKQFGVTLLIAVLISAVNALTLSPALCAVFLKVENEETKKKGFLARFFDAFNVGFNSLTNKYVSSFSFLLKHKWVSVLILLLCLGGIYLGAKVTPTGFIPSEDRGFVFGNFQMAPTVSGDQLASIQQEFAIDAQAIPGVEIVNLVAGFSFINGQGPNYGMAMIRLTPWDERKAPDMSAEAIIGKLFGLAKSKYQEAGIIFFQPPSVPGYGMSGGFELKLLDHSASPIHEFDQKSQEFIMDLMSHPEIQYAQTSLNTNYAQYELELNVVRAKESGVLVTDILTTLQGYVGGIYATDFTRFGKHFRVMVQALPKYRASEKDISELYVRTDSGQMTPITQFVNLKRVYGAQSITRFNLFNSSNISGGVTPGYSTGAALQAIETASKENLSNSYSVDFTGLSREEIKASSQTLIIFILSVVFVYFFLAAQYESYLIPFSVLLPLPAGLMGAFWAQKLAGLENNIYFQIALIMLLGLLAKNAILIVEFALQRRRQGESIAQSAIDGAKARLRPILMTSLAFVFGLMPLVFSSGVGAVGNRSIGTGAVFGLLIGTIIGVFIIPVFYTLFEYLQEKIKPIKFDNDNLEENEDK